MNRYQRGIMEPRKHVACNPLWYLFILLIFIYIYNMCVYIYNIYIYIYSYIFFASHIFIAPPYDWLEEKYSQCFWGETYDMVEVYRRHFFYLGTWRRISGKMSQ